MSSTGSPEPAVSEFCRDCGWYHTNVQSCWRRLRREAEAKLADPLFTGPLRIKLQEAFDAFEADRSDLQAFFVAVNAGHDPDDDDL